jgi:hypothetical protein
MKPFLAISSISAFIGLAICQTQTTCTADDILNSITAVQHYARKMQSVTDSSNENIDTSGVSPNIYFEPISSIKYISAK